MQEADKTDPFNYPFPKRNELMSLSTINFRDIGFRKVKIEAPDCLKLKTSDIDGAQPQIHGYKYNQKECFINKNDDIDGSRQVNQYDQFYGKPSLNLKNNDIKGAQPQKNQFITTRLPSNPLCPEYRLPYSEIRLPTPPKFVRDSIQIQDIDGARPNPYYKFKPRKNNIFVEIEGTKVKERFIPRDQIDIMNVKDINEFLKFETRRAVNPLNPEYILTGENGEIIHYGPIDKNTSKELHPKIVNKMQSTSLKINDILGANSGSHSNLFLRRDERKDFRNTTYTTDVPGAQAGTVRKGFTTLRQTNPLQPVYTYLGENEGFYLKGHLPSYYGKIQMTTMPNTGEIILQNAPDKNGSNVFSQTAQQTLDQAKFAGDQQSGKAQSQCKSIKSMAHQSDKQSQQQQQPVAIEASNTQQVIEKAQSKVSSKAPSLSSKKSQHQTIAQKLDQFIQS